MEVDIYGHSDDLIEVEGDVREELYANFNADTLIRVGEYTFTVSYDGEWSFEPESTPGNANMEIIPVGKCEKYNDYSQVVRINDNHEAGEVEKVE